MGNTCSSNSIIGQVVSQQPTLLLNRTPEQETLLTNFYNQYPELKQVYNSSNNLSQEKQTQFKNEFITFINQSPVPTVSQLYTFTLQALTKYNISINPTDTQIEALNTSFATKYSYMQEYIDAIKDLSGDNVNAANLMVTNFYNTYPLGSVDDFYKLIVGVLKKYNLPVPPEAFQNYKKESFQNSKNTFRINYSKISANMDSYIGNRSLVEKSYSSFNR